MQRADSLGKTLMLGNIEGRRRRGKQGIRWLDSITDSMNMNLSKLREIMRDREAWRASVPEVSEESDMTKSQTQLSDWTKQEFWSGTGKLEGFYLSLYLAQKTKSPSHTHTHTYTHSHTHTLSSSSCLQLTSSRWNGEDTRCQKLQVSGYGYLVPRAYSPTGRGSEGAGSWHKANPLRWNGSPAFEK